jgi:hypothetical protein
MRNFLDGVPADGIDTEYDDDTIEMVLSESAMQMLSQAAAQAEQPCPTPTPPLQDPDVRAIGSAMQAGGPEVQGIGPALKTVDPEVRVIAPDVAAIGSAVPATPAEQTFRELRPPMSRLRLAMLLSAVAVASAILTAVTYTATTRTVRPGPIRPSVVSNPPVPAIVAPSPPPLPAPLTEPAEPVRFVNPFDRKEVFEFPAGTSEADARDAVANLLYERAEERRGAVRGIVSGMSVRHPTGATAAAAAPAARKSTP